MYYSETLWALKFELYIIFTCHEFFFFKLKKNRKRKLWLPDYRSTRQVRFGSWTVVCHSLHWEILRTGRKNLVLLFAGHPVYMTPTITLHPCRSSWCQSLGGCLLLPFKQQLYYTSLDVPESWHNLFKPELRDVPPLSSWGQYQLGTASLLESWI